ncbi:MAG: hypothetical protein BRC23_02475 [Parcubacteria group bacterium SW_4_49_11]|nr:MAG: hypothetical protein BRC23_02475 [Parcubacteria group bacterium SW_4_49_11]
MNRKKQQTRTSRSLFSFGTYAALLVIVAVAFVGMFQTERARSFEDNPQNPPNNNATLPINVSDREQAKQGELLVGEGAPPQNALDVSGDAHIEGNKDSGTAGESATLDLAVDDNDSGVNMPSDGTLTLWTNNSEEMRIQSNGNVGMR